MDIRHLDGDTTPVSLYLSDADGRLLDANLAMVEMLAYPDRASLLATDTHELYADPSTRDAWKERLLAEGVVRGFETRLRRYDGSTLWIRESTSMRRLDDGAVVFTGSFEDITAQKQAEAALEENRRVLETLLSNLPGMAYRCRNEPDWSMEFVSEGCRRLTGYSPADLIGNRRIAYGELIHPDDRELVWRQVQDAVSRRRPFELQYRILDANEQLRWVAEQGRGVYDDDNRLLFLEGFVSDVSEQRVAMKAVRDSEAWYRTLFEAANDAILLMDGDRFVDCNSKTLQIFACGAERIIGHSPADLSPTTQADGSDSLASSLEWVAAALRGEPQFFEWQHLRGDGNPIDVEVNLCRVEVAGHAYLQAIVRDITARKATERALRCREAILEAVSFAAAKFLKSPTWQELADEVLEHFGRAAEASRVYLFEGYRDEHGRRLARQRFEWAAPEVASRLDRPELQRMSAAALGVERWADAITVGGMIHGCRSDFEGREQELLQREGVLSVVVVPVFAAGDLWGFLGVDDCQRERRWSDGEIEAIRAAAEILGGAVYLELARRALQNRTEALEILNRVNTLLASALDAREVMQEIADIVRIRCGVDHVSVCLLDEDSGQLQFAAWSGYEAPQRHTGVEVDGPGMIARATRDKRPQWVPDVSRTDGYLCGDGRVRSEYAVPLMLHGEAMGVLNCESFAEDGIGVWQRDVIDRLAAQAAVALRNAEIVRSLEPARDPRSQS